MSLRSRRVSTLLCILMWVLTCMILESLFGASQILTDMARDFPAAFPSFWTDSDSAHCRRYERMPCMAAAPARSMVVSNATNHSTVHMDTEACNPRDVVTLNWTATYINLTFVLAIDKGVLRRHLCEAAASGPVVVTFGSKHQLGLLLNWLVWLELVDVRNVLVFALDEPTDAFLRDHDVPSMLIPVPNMAALWVVRTALLRAVLQVNRTFIHSDIDALWRKNPVPYLMALNYSVVFSQGSIAPIKQWKTWGFVLCAGFSFARPSPFAVVLFESILAKLLTLKSTIKAAAGDSSDQDAVNQVHRPPGGRARGHWWCRVRGHWPCRAVCAWTMLGYVGTSVCVQFGYSSKARFPWGPWRVSHMRILLGVSVCVCSVISGLCLGLCGSL